MGKIELTRAQADLLAKLEADAARSAETFRAALNAVALAVADNGAVSYDFGQDPWLEVKQPSEPQAI